MNQFAKEILPIFIEEEMQSSYLNYAMSVIVGRALPDARDGLKPVHRRILFAMHELNNYWNRPFKKSARIVGDVIGKYHPHGDSAVYDAIVRMAQNFSLRYILIDGQGNFGSIDGDSAAAMRYTETRISKIGHELLANINEETVDFCKNYDSSENEPVILPSRIPNLLINGSSGIAVGMATNIPPHNLGEVIDACKYLLQNPSASIQDLIKILPAPDFPTAGIIYGVEGIHEAYLTGKGKVIIRANIHFEKIHLTQRVAIIVDEIPYQVNKRLLLEKFSELINNKRLEGIYEIRDESDKSGMRIVLELKKDEIPEIILNKLYKLTQLEDSFGINMVALVNNQPKLLNLKEIIECYLSHRREILTRKTIHELRKANERAHILEGFTIALSNIDKFILLIKSAPNPIIAKTKLTEKFWDTSTFDNGSKVNNFHISYDNHLTNNTKQKNNLYKLSQIQAQEILQLRLQKLTNLEQNKISQEYQDIKKQINYLNNILNDSKLINSLLFNELCEIKMEFNDKRRSKIQSDIIKINEEDLISPKKMVVTISYLGYIKSQPLSEYQSQKRGGRGKQAATIKENDWINSLFIANIHDYILFFSNYGQVYWVKVYDVPQGLRNSRGRPILNMLPLKKEEQITAALPIKEFKVNKNIVMATAFGIIKKTALNLFKRPLRKGIIAVKLNKGDYLISAAITNGNDDIMLFSDSGKAIKFNENDVRSMGRAARGVKGMHLNDDSKVISMLVASKNNNQFVLTVTENGYGKRTLLNEYTKYKRGGKGIITIKTSKRNGKVVAATLVEQNTEILLITTAGILIRTNVSEIRKMGRATQGVTLINLDKGTKLSGLQNIIDVKFI